MTGIGVLLRF